MGMARVYTLFSSMRSLHSHHMCGFSMCGSSLHVCSSRVCVRYMCMSLAWACSSHVHTEEDVRQDGALQESLQP